MERLKNTFLLFIGLVIIIGSFYIVLNKPAPARYQTPTNSSQPTDNPPSPEATDGQGSISNPTKAYIRVGGFVLPTEIAETEAAREQGLSGRESILSGHGMLFIFEKPGTYGFWMKDMHFAIDIIWINENGEVVGVEKGVEPETFPTVFYPPAPVAHVLELRAGDADLFSIDTGTKLYLDR